MAIIVEFQTRRLNVAHWREAFADNGARARLEAELGTFLTPTTTAFLPPPMQVGAEDFDITDWIDARASESDVCTVRVTDGPLVGLLILHVDGDVIRIGYLFGETHWRQGYATELLTGFVDWCAGTGKPYKLIGGVEADNKASIRVLEKAGFVLDDANSTATNRFYHLRLT